MRYRPSNDKSDALTCQPQPLSKSAKLRWLAHLKAFARLARPHQYVKNAFVFLPILFGHRLMDSNALRLCSLAFVTFCLIAGAVYTMNDIMDRDEDRRHPQKCLRPLASYEVSIREAILFSLILFFSAVVILIRYLPYSIWSIVGAYVGINLAYSVYLRNLAILDIFCISSGFVLRVLAGAVSADIIVSHWMLIMTFLLALFMALAKRRNDFVIMELNNEQVSRKSITGYNLEFLSMSMIIASSVVIVAYILYTVSPQTLAIHGEVNLYVSSIWIILGLMRYLQITFVEKKTLSPTSIILKDRFMQITILAWVLHIYLLLYTR